jgi:hypothetical protein
MLPPSRREKRVRRFEFGWASPVSVPIYWIEPWVIFPSKASI